MTPDEARRRAVAHWLELAAESLRVAKLAEAAQSPHSAVNRAYYACFYAASALFLQEGLDFSKHTAVRSAVNRDLALPGRLEFCWAKLYNELFDARHEGDYQPLRDFHPEQVEEYVDGAAGFVERLRELVEASQADDA